MPRKRKQDYRSRNIHSKLTLFALVMTVIFTALFVQVLDVPVAENPVVEVNPTATVVPQQPTMPPPTVEQTLADYERLFVRATAEAGVNLPATIQAGGQLMLRTEPRIDTETVGPLYNGEHIQVLGRSADSNWLKIKDQDSAMIGWVYKVFISGIDDVETLPIIGYAGQINAPGGMIIRVEARVDSETIGQLSNGDLVTVIGKSVDNQWVKIQSHADPEIVGWVFSQFVAVHAGRDSLLIVRYYGQINAPGGIIVRAEPILPGIPLGQMHDNDLVTVIGKSLDNQWVKIQIYDDPEIVGWVFSQFINVSTPIDSLPFVIEK